MSTTTGIDNDDLPDDHTRVGTPLQDAASDGTTVADHITRVGAPTQDAAAEEA